MKPTFSLLRQSLRWFLRSVAMIAVLLAGPALIAASGGLQGSDSWRTADRSSAGIAPTPEEHPQAIVQVYGARAFGWRGNFAVHTWIATKPANADSYQVHEVTGWGRRKVRSGRGEPDRAWFGNPPRLYADLRGERAEALIPGILQAIDEYPYPETYNAWPGPNSNTFVSWVIREVDGLNVALPNHAIGKDYLDDTLVTRTPAGTGYQVSLGGYLGLLASVREGIELNVLGLSIGIDPLHLGIKLPGVGQLGLRDPWIEQIEEAPEG